MNELLAFSTFQCIYFALRLLAFLIVFFVGYFLGWLVENKVTQKNKLEEEIKHRASAEQAENNAYFKIEILMGEVGRLQALIKVVDETMSVISKSVDERMKNIEVKINELQNKKAKTEHRQPRNAGGTSAE